MLNHLQGRLDEALEEVESHQRLAKRIRGDHPVYKVTKIPERVSILSPLNIKWQLTIPAFTDLQERPNDPAE